MKRSFITILCLVIALVTLLTACGGGGKKPQETNPPTTNPTGTPSNPDDVILQELVPAKNIDRDIKILSDYPPGDDIHEENGDPMWDVEVKMYLYIEEKFNVTLEYQGPSSGLAWSTLDMLKGSDLNEFDLLYSPQPTSGMHNLLTGGYLANLHEVNSVNLQGDWFNQSQASNHTANGKLFLAVPDFTIGGQGLPSIIYNVERYAALGFTEDLYATVKAGGWTIDKLISMVKEASSSNIGGDPNTATYSMGYWKNITYCQMYAMGENILVKNTDGEFERGLNVERLTTIAEKLNSLINDVPGAVVVSATANAGFADSEMWKAFSSNRALFFTMDIGSINFHLRTLDFNVKYLPLPKLYEADDHRSICASGFCGIPNIAYDKEDSGMIFTSMAIYGYEHVKPALFENILFGRLSKEPADYEMLNYLHATKFYEFGYTFDESSKLRDLMTNIVFNPAGIGGSKAVSAALRANNVTIAEIIEKANSLGEDIEE